MIQRQIVGPQDQYERSGAQALRDIRPFTTRLSEALRSSASGVVLAAAATGTFLFPAVLDLTLPASVFYAAWVLTRRVLLPIRLPESAATLDYGNPDPGTRKAKKAESGWIIGWDLQGHEIWVTADDLRQHMTIPGTTGAGKTTTILSLLENALAQGSGFVLVDGKAQRDVYAKVLAMARRFGREDDVRVINFMVASGLKDSNTWNVFATGNADALREILASQLGEQAAGDSNGVFRERAVALIGTMAPVLVWLRDHKAISLNVEVIRDAIPLNWIWKMAMEKIAVIRNTETGETTDIDVGGEIPEEIISPLRSYLGELPGYDPSMPLDKQKGDEPSKQHGFLQMYFTPIFTQLGVSLGHIFKVPNGDIDMRDVVLNRRILVVNLPALENSDATLAALGKLVVASLRGMMAQLLGISLEGDYSVEDKPGMGPAPFPIVLDEMAYYATSGLDRMLAMGRGLNISFMLGFQEVSGIWARLGEKTASLLGNANLTIAMRQQEAGRTREWLEKTAGQTNVTQVTSYQGANDGLYREARSAEIRTVYRVDWQDLTNLIEGEAIILFGGRRIYAKVFHASVSDAGPKRLGRTVMLLPPDAGAVRARVDHLARMVRTIEGGKLGEGGSEEQSPVLAALIERFTDAAIGGADPRGCAQAALASVGKVPECDLPARPLPPADGMPVSSVTPMLQAASKAVFAGPDTAAHPNEPVDVRVRHRIEAIEALAGAPQHDVRGIALSILGDRDEALDAIVPVEPPAMTLVTFQAHLAAVTNRVEAITARAALKRAA